jgi:restriction endonuclease-like protein
VSLSHELTYGEVPSVIYAEDATGRHGNFLPAVYRRICASVDWRKRLQKVYTASRHVPRSQERQRRELDCANSSDALLMNVFCYPGVMNRATVCSMLGVAKGARPEFGFRPMTPLHNGKVDRTEVDMRLGELLIEAKLTEGDFQTARLDLVLRYRDFEEVFDPELLPVRNGSVRSYQLIRGVLAAFACSYSFCVLCDARRPELIEDWYRIARAVQSAELRSRLRVLTWQELSPCLVPIQQRFLREKYGIERS